MMLIDVFRVKDELYAWLFNKGKSEFYRCVYQPKIFVSGSYKKLEYVRQRLLQLGLKSHYEIKQSLNGPVQVVSVRTTINNIKHLVAWIYRVFGYECEVYNSDIPVEESYMFEHNIFPTCRVKFKLIGSYIVNLQTSDMPFDNWELPELSTLEVKLIKKFGEIKGIRTNISEVTGINSLAIAERFLKLFERYNPDIIVTRSSELAELLGFMRSFFPSFSFSRFGRDEFSSKLIRCFSYGKSFLKPSKAYLKGRLHFIKNRVLYGNWSPEFVFEIARVCRLSPQKSSQRSVGYAINNLQYFHAFQRGIILGRTESCVENWKSGIELLEADRGSFVFQPKLGFHRDVAELDFSSLFPLIMVKHNISTETLFCECCKQNKVPGLELNICTRKKGIMAELLEPMINTRERYKQLNIYEARANALKALLVTSFGYMGFRKSRLARIEAHQAIQAYAREILLKATKIAERRGFEILHGIVDSLWVTKHNLDYREFVELADEISKATGMKIRVEAVYRWIAFLPSVNNSRVPIATSYFGLLDNGSFKYRGIQLRQSNSPKLVCQLQEEIFEKLKSVGNYNEFYSKKKECKQLLKDKLSSLVKDRVLISKLKSRKHISSCSKFSLAQQQNKDCSKRVENLSYFIRRDGLTTEKEYHSSGNSDIVEYAKLLKKAYLRIFGWLPKQQKRLFEFGV